jgi:transposase
MAFIRTQKLVRNEDGSIKSGSAEIVDVQYVKGARFHSKQVIRERLGRVIYLSENKKSGIFLSPTRGLIEYDASSDSFSPVDKGDDRLSSQELFPDPEIHTVFGDTYLLFTFLKNSGLIDILRTVFPKDSDYERLLCHVLHGILRDGSRIACDDFIAKSFASYVLDDIPQQSLHSDTEFFTIMGDDHVKISFFSTFVEAMRKTNPEFGKGCYVDSSPLPNEIDDNPFNALSCHGIASSSDQIRLILVLDEESGLPVWYDIIPGNVLDINTVMNVVADVAETLDIQIDSLVLDAGYVSKELIHAIHIGSEKTMIGRMPARRGYPYKTLYWQIHSMIGKGKYQFVRKKHVYFGRRMDVEVFGEKEYAYVYVDQNNALQKFRDYRITHEDEYEAMKDKDKDWYTVRFGYFVLLSNRKETPEQLLTEYFERTEIETVFKASKEYLGLLPLSKWTDTTVRGKILHDIVDTIVLLELRKKILPVGVSVSSLAGKTQSLMCFLTRNKQINVETPSKQVKQYYDLFDLKVPAHLKLDKFRTDVLGIKM